MSTEPRKTRAEVRRQHRQELLIQAAEAELNDVGLQATTLERVGQRVGLSKGALYYYVDSRDELLNLLLDDVLQQQRAEANHLAADDASAVERLRAFAHGHVRVAVNRPAGRMIVSHLDLLATNERAARLLYDQTVFVRDIITEAVKDGNLRHIEPTAATAVFFGALNTIPRAYDPAGHLDLETVVDAAIDMLFDGWRPR